MASLTWLFPHYTCTNFFYVITNLLRSKYNSQPVNRQRKERNLFVDILNVHQGCIKPTINYMLVDIFECITGLVKDNEQLVKRN